MSNRPLIVVKENGWTYFSKDFWLVVPQNAGKWSVYFKKSKLPIMLAAAERAVEEDICVEASCSDPKLCNKAQGVLQLYGIKDDYSFHIRCTEFLVENKLIRRAPNGELLNIAFTLANPGRNRKCQDCLYLNDLRSLKSGHLKHL